MNPYIQNDSSLSLDDFTEAGRRLMFDQEDHCYQMFSSYRLNGYWMLKRDFDEIDDMSFPGMVQYSQDKELLFNGKDDAIDLMSGVLGHNYMELFSSGDTVSSFSVDDLTGLIRYAVSTGSYPFDSLWDSTCQYNAEVCQHHGFEQHCQQCAEEAWLPEL